MLSTLECQGNGFVFHLSAIYLHDLTMPLVPGNLRRPL
jgi:hypothetical protein